MELDELWETYDLDSFRQGMNTLFPGQQISLDTLLSYIGDGRIMEAISYLGEGLWAQAVGQLAGVKNIFLWLLVLGIVSAVLGYFVEIFDKHQVAEISFYFIYLLLFVMLFQCFGQMCDVAGESIEQIVLFVKLLMPTYLIAVGVSTGVATAGVFSTFLMLIIYIVEKILVVLVLPMIQAYFLLTMMNGIWMEEKLSLIIQLLKKALAVLLKSALGVLTGIGLFQVVLTPALDHAKNSVLEKVVAALPGVGNGARSITEILVGSATVIKNGLGILLVLLLFTLCALPLLRLLLMMLAVKGAAAFMGIISDKRLTQCVNRAGDSFGMLLRLTSTAMLLFIIVIMLLAMGSPGIG